MVFEIGFNDYSKISLLPTRRFLKILSLRGRDFPESQFWSISVRPIIHFWVTKFSEMIFIDFNVLIGNSYTIHTAKSFHWLHCRRPSRRLLVVATENNCGLWHCAENVTVRYRTQAERVIIIEQKNDIQTLPNRNPIFQILYSALQFLPGKSFLKYLHTLNAHTHSYWQGEEPYDTTWNVKN